MENGLILSTTGIETPLYIKELGISLYTLEELCYYIYRYLEMIDDRFIDEDFLNFLRKSREFEGLADKMIRWINSGSDLGQILYMIEQDIHYLNGNELSDLKARIEWMRDAAPAERLKKKADILVGLKKHRRAIMIYNEMLENERSLKIKANMKGVILHNRGVAQAKLFMFAEASESLVLAYSLLGSEDILKELYFLQALDKETVGEPACMLNADEALKEKWQTEIDGYMEAAMQSEKYLEISDAAGFDYYKKSSYFYDLIIEWKNEYRNMVK